MKFQLTQTRYLNKHYLEVVTTDIKGGNESRPLILIIDKSGSMCGTSFTTLKQSIRKNFDLVTSFAPIVFFDSKVTLVRTIREFDGIQADGCTDFAKAFASTLSLINQNKNKFKNVDVLFLTDGECHENKKSDKEFQDEIKNAGGKIHVIGYGSEHDLNRMMKIVGDKSLGNTYQYCKNASEIETTLVNIVSFNKSTKVVLKIHKDKKPIEEHHLFLCPTDGIASTQIELIDMISPTDKVICDGSEFPVETKETTISDKIDILMNLLETQPTLENIKFIQTEVEYLDDNILKIQKSFDRYERKAILGQMMELKRKLNDSIISQNASSFEQRARNFAASRAVPSRQMNIKRSQKIIDYQDSAIKSCDKNAQFASKNLGSLDSTLDPNFDPCELSMMTANELASEADCIGVTVNVSRSDASIVVPSLVQLLTIAPHVLSFGSFRNLVDSSPDSEEYNKIASVMKKDRYFSHPFNALLPLFVNDAHWSVAKHYWPITCGWVVGLDERLGDWGMVGPVVCSFSFWFWQQDSNQSTTKSEKQQLLDHSLWTTLLKLSEKSTVKNYIDQLLVKHSSNLLNKTEVPNLKALIGAMNLRGIKLSDQDVKGFSLEILRRRFHNKVDNSNSFTELCNILTDKDDPFSVTKTTLWKEEINIIPNVKPTLTFDEKTAFIIWAIQNASDDKIENWSHTHMDVINDYEAVAKAIHSKVWEKQRQLEVSRLMQEGHHDKALEYLKSEQEYFTLADVGLNHIYEHSFLGQLLAEARSRKGNIKKSKEKYQFLVRKLGVSLSKRNENAFI